MFDTYAFLPQVAADILPSLHVVVRCPTPPHANSREAQPVNSPSAPYSDQRYPTQNQSQSQSSQQPAIPQCLPRAATSSIGAAGEASAGTPFAYSNGNQASATPPSPMPPLIPLGNISRAPPVDGPPQAQMLSARSSGTLPNAAPVSIQNGTQASPSAVPMPGRQLPLPRPQSRPQHGPVNAGPTLHPPSGSQVTKMLVVCAGGTAHVDTATSMLPAGLKFLCVEL